MLNFMMAMILAMHLFSPPFDPNQLLGFPKTPNQQLWTSWPWEVVVAYPRRHEPDPTHVHGSSLVASREFSWVGNRWVIKTRHRFQVNIPTRLGQSARNFGPDIFGLRIVLLSFRRMHKRAEDVPINASQTSHWRNSSALKLTAGRFASLDFPIFPSVTR